MTDKKYKIKHDRPNCIGCTACANVAPDFWEMSDVDGKSDIIDGERKPDGCEVLDISEGDFKANMDAAEACPVNVIHLINIGTKEEVI
ncbi:ferredoxin [Candidatus Peregrinibacteria bacterium]|jgi:ferredoxin|nr:ferredoxin [Candidatus Peregrinibacteria bacterium]MBT4631533.1 ferredoxin [Candidatus Peregrinibacteria bacterium]MBT5516372.1 ferredoxin [Candidatus Peregrinibacteria bacterium]MBT5824271.1 ferredoxin [Candidatus Peregrinibacteria bacterium]